MSEHLELETFNTRGSGIWFRARSGANLNAHEVVYVGADGLLYPANAAAATTMPAVGITIFPISPGTYGEVLSRGFIGDTSWTWNTGAILYVAPATGAISETAALIPQQVGIALSATQIYFDASLAGGGGGGLLSYEVQTGIIAEPTTTSLGNGHAVVVHNETEERDFLWIRTDLDTKWAGCEFL